MARKRTANQSAVGPLSNRSAGARHYVPDRVEFAPSERVTNSLQTEPLVMSAIWTSAIRPGSQVAFSLPSRGWA
jgi:hypothetical protein